MKNKRLKILTHDFSKGVEVTDHFIERAHERFGVTDLHDQAKNHDYVTRWALGLLQDYSIYYREARKYANDLAKLHTKLAALYEVQSKSSHNSVIDNKQQSINQVNSIIIEIENKLLNIHNVVFDRQEDKVRTS